MKIICFEGIDASGKATQVDLLAERLHEQGYTVDIVSFPCYQSFDGELIKKALKKEVKMSDYALHLLMEWQKYDLVTSMDYLELDYLIIDRYTLSNIIYMAVKGMDVEWIKGVQKYLPAPDITFILDIPVEESFKRRPKREDKIEEDKELLKKVRELYVDYVHNNNTEELVYLIDAVGKTEQVHYGILEVLSLAGVVGLDESR